MGYSWLICLVSRSHSHNFLAFTSTIIAKKRYSSTLLDDLDFIPVSDHWSLPPQSSIDPSQYENRALITIEYNKINPNLSDKFEHNIHELGRLLKSEGMAYWELFQDPADTSHYIEIRIAILGLIISVNMNLLPRMLKLWKIESVHLSRIAPHQ